MLKPAMNELLANVENRYLLVNLAAQRARDIADEALETGEKLNDKAVKLALDEIAAGTIHYCPGPKPQPVEEPALSLEEAIQMIDFGVEESEEAFEMEEESETEAVLDEE